MIRGQSAINPKYQSRLGVERAHTRNLSERTSGATIGLFQRRDTVTFKGQKYKNPSYLLRWIDSGTTQRKTKKGKNRGTLAAKYFFRTAIEQTGVKAANELETNILNSIDKIANKR